MSLRTPGVMVVDVGQWSHDSQRCYDRIVIVCRCINASVGDMRISSLTTVLVVTILLPFALSNEQWSIPTHSQYHIQTDEGPERYFQYQTQSGQFRKEKRLEDGTVIGTSAWIDANGFLWLRDYVADNQGYRIVRSKNLYVGTDTPIERAVKAAKYSPASAGESVQTNASPSPAYSYTPSITPQTTYPSTSYLPQVQINPNSGTGYGSTHLPADVRTLVTSTPSPASATSPVVNIPANPSTTASPIFEDSTTPSGISTTTQSNTYLPANTNNYAQSTPSSLYLPAPPASSSTVSPPLTSNSVDYPEYSGAPQYEHYSKPFVNPYIFQNGPTYPIDKNGNTFNGQMNKLGNGYDPQYPEYDGVSVTNDGFRYFIPRAYHEEQSLPGNTKAGSFGYIDPFGIRRVIYYNASPEKGFQHRKNNRYVGFNATPYDPRPY